MNAQRIQNGLGKLVLFFTVCLSISQITAEETLGQSVADEQQTASEAEPTMNRLSLEAARERAELMHKIYTATLETLHHHYFHGDRATVPARAMKDVFKDMEAQTDVQSRWISASLKPMSIDNKPETPFEKHAAKQIAAKEEKVETIEDGFYRRAGSISLNRGCIGCHAGLLNSSTSQKFAGLIISVPVEPGAKLADVEESSLE